MRPKEKKNKKEHSWWFHECPSSKVVYLKFIADEICH